MNADVIIIGCGAAGLMAARSLAKAGKKVLVVEARDRPGGRIHTLHNQNFSYRIEAGPEFIHGDLPVTNQLIKEASLSTFKVSGSLWNAREDPHKQNDFLEGSDRLIKALKDLQQDISVQQFLDQYFTSESDNTIRESILGYVQGYDLADPKYASAYALKEEWTSDEDADQWRINEGYGALVDHLQMQCLASGCEFLFQKIVKKINWKPGLVSIVSAKGEIFTGRQAVITIPLGVLQSGPEAAAHIDFTPSLNNKLAAAKKIGFGKVIKWVMEFKDPFWEKLSTETGFIFSGEPVPTWWTQLEKRTNILTGWLGGPDAIEMGNTPQEQLENMAIGSLARIFKIKDLQVREKISACEIFNWGRDPFALGGYSYRSLNAEECKKAVSEPLDNTLFFAGEALAIGAEAGTVEAAFRSGLSVAGQILD